MKDYDFEYTSQGIAYTLFFVSFALIGIGAMALSRLISNYILLDVISSVALGVIFFLLNKHRIKKIGQAHLSNNEIILSLSDTKPVNFDDLKYYYMYDGKNGIVFTLGLLDGTKFKIGANNNFCDIDPLKSFLTDFEVAIDRYNTQNQADVIHLESILARKNAVYVLFGLTILTITGFIFMKMPLMCIPIGFALPVIINWIQYFRLKIANKLVNF